MAESLTRFSPGKNRGSLQEHQRSDLRRWGKTAQGSTAMLTPTPPLGPWGGPTLRADYIAKTQQVPSAVSQTADPHKFLLTESLVVKARTRVWLPLSL